MLQLKQKSSDMITKKSINMLDDLDKYDFKQIQIPGKASFKMSCISKGMVTKIGNKVYHYESHYFASYRSLFIFNNTILGVYETWY